MWPGTPLTRLLGVRYPIVQAPMANGPSTPALAAAVSDAGALGSLGFGFLPPEAVREGILATRRLTDRPFGVNLFVPQEPPRADPEEALALLDPFRDELGIKRTALGRPPTVAFEDAVAVVLEERPAVFSFTFGTLRGDVVSALKENGVTVLGTGTTLSEGEELERLGVDAVVAQSSEAGGHRGTFAADLETAMIGGMALIPQLADRLGLPVVVAGGIMDGRGIVAALALGAAGVQLGTAFLVCPESGAHPAHKRAVLEGSDESTVVTRAFTGKPARGFRNRLVRELERHADRLAPFPVQAFASADVREEAAKQGEPELMTMLAGQGVGLARALPAGELVATLAAEAEETLRRLAS